MAWFLLVPASLALAQGTVASEAQARRFVAAYRADEIIALVARDAIYDVSMQDGPNKPYYACVNAKLTGAAFQPLALQIVQAQFPDASRLQDATTFFETDIGQKMRDASVEQLRQRPARRTAGQALAQPGDYPSTAAALNWSREFKKRPAYQDFSRFKTAIEAVGTNPAIRIPLKELQTACTPG